MKELQNWTLKRVNSTLGVENKWEEVMLKVARVFKYIFFTLWKSCCSAVTAELSINTCIASKSFGMIIGGAGYKEN